MGLMNLNKAASKYTSEPMKGNIERLVTFDLYHCLLAGGLSTSIRLQDKYSCFPSEYLEWLKVCDGGLLFDTVILSSKAHDDELNLDFDSYDEVNAEEGHLGTALPAGYVIFAMRSYGDLICFSHNKTDDKVYLWDIENGAFSNTWNSFTDWITEEIDDGIKLIADEVLDPLNLKLEESGDE